MSLAEARRSAEAGRFDEMLAVCEELIARRERLLETGALLLQQGFLGLAREALKHAGDDWRVRVNLANIARDAGDHGEAGRLYAALLRERPDDSVIRRNALTGQEYDPAVADSDRLAQAKAWGEWAMRRAGGWRPRPPMPPLAGRPLRVGYVSADFCQHTVGLFVKDVLAAHRFEVFAYSSGMVSDWVTRAIRQSCRLVDVRGLDDPALAQRIRDDRIDILVDLSGHTAGSRLTAFAYRPAPYMLTWLGYFASTGLPVLDGVLMDEDGPFVEPLIPVPGRFCYTPVPWMPAVAPLPCLSRGSVTFGCFNNTAKLNPAVFDLWARILREVAGARLILKWRTFNDAGLRARVRAGFAERGVDPGRVELRGPSFHADLLHEYADIDVALDPFPFSGGLTSCEALWLGVPVVTWPQSRVVSRQTHGFLRAIGLPELSAANGDDYVRIAVELARDQDRLVALRQGLRERMRASPLCDVAGFTRNLETVLENLVMKTLLNVGAGHPQSGARIPQAFVSWKEIRLDIDPANQPDILGSMLDMAAVADASVDAIYSSHNIEHLYPNEIARALEEFLRVLRPHGFAVITCPDLQAAARMIAEDRLLDVAYQSPAGPVTPFDLVYSHRQFTGRDNPFMAHHCGFTLSTLMGTLQANGFASVAGKRRPAAFDLWVVASKQPLSEEGVKALADEVLPE